MSTTATPTPQRESIAILASVYWDRERSSPWAEVYRAASDTYVGRTYDLRHYPESGAWTCNCPAIMPCKHIARCARLRRLRWWNARLVECTTAELLIERRRRVARVEAGQADDDDLSCLDAIDLRLDRDQYGEVA